MSAAENLNLDHRERINVRVFADASEVNAAVAGEIAALIRLRKGQNQPCVLGLATGSTPMGIYQELIRLHKAGELSFKNVVTFNLDEYYPMGREELQSYWRFTHEQLFDHVDIDPKNVHIPDGTVPIERMAEYCRKYEKQIANTGGMDLLLLGVGRTGHIGFNEPGSSRESRTRLITLDHITRQDAASDFFGEEHVPRRAITMGVGTILEAKKILLVAFGEHKAHMIARAVEGPVTPSVAASFLQEHASAQILLDLAAAAELTRFKTPWLVSTAPPAGVVWNDRMTRKAVIWLAETLNKPILKLTDEDYNEHGLQDLVAARESAYEINISVFRALQETITGWPGGKPAGMKRPGDINRPTDAVFPKRVLIFSPHPDDDVISMGGTLIRLADQGHEVHIAYQTSGNIAVFDTDAVRFADFAAQFNQLFGIGGAREASRVEKHIEEFLHKKKPGQIDSVEVQKIKSLIRQGEARAAGRSCGIAPERLHFMNLPFYETGGIRKRPLSRQEIRLTIDLLKKIKPHQIYAAGDLSDPHGTHRICLAAVLEAIKCIRKTAGASGWIGNCEIWLYRGAWQEWEPEKIEMAVPLSPDELLRKRLAIFKHQSQKDRAMFPGVDQREFWQRAQDRNRATAKIYDRLGLAEYEAIEGFVRWHER
ncbi:MAG TPA: glucosamine-6-phosphate deaminase [Phycisphaerae bacterium]|nr:glucosamine-6-phosphate deaminase [Phycisphaerae bacterium]